ncbi:hypothetical protein MFRU_018g01490 [Monilinia fructicola]|uniref:Uncharacterized protein n=1 Tax=Monilinia fructicola TaxID=38448 RepID=A0A5M9JW98_MONFR|nr:hypothetical protein EYC84_002069 [Monilinia fructicola]KAG4029044.1 hypothetical protein MFRU_018g01490 [Monilinia fructicola]
MAPQEGLPLGDEGDGGSVMDEGERDDGDGGIGGASMSGVNSMGENSNYGSQPPAHTQNSYNYPSTTYPLITTTAYKSVTSTDLAITSAFTTSSMFAITATSSMFTSISTSAPKTTFQMTTTEYSSRSLETSTSTPFPDTGASTQSVSLTSIPQRKSTQDSLTNASIAGITIGVLFIFALILAVLWYFLQRQKKNKNHRKSIGGFDGAKWNGAGIAKNDMQQVPPSKGSVKPGMGIQRVLSWSTMRGLTHSRTRSSASETSSISSQETLRNPAVDQQRSVSSLQDGNTGSARDGGGKDGNREGGHEYVVDFGDPTEWIRNKERRRDREGNGLALGGPGQGVADWRYSVRVNGGGNNL